MNRIIVLLLITVLLTSTKQESPFIPEVAVSLQNDTLRSDDLHQGSLLIFYKQPYCHDCLPEMIKHLQHSRELKHQIFILMESDNIIMQRTEYNFLLNKGCPISESNFLRYPVSGSSSKGHLYALKCNDSTSIKWTYEEIMKKRIRRKTNL
ncbi:MAG: hypothetical protein GC181_15895 [Bacteroidetes bacterium]|nr:hypothetical protein [Bacteroidota bacterium]